MRGIRIESHQPSLYIARLPKFSKYCWVCTSGASASAKDSANDDSGHRLLLDAVDVGRLRDAGEVEDQRVRCR